MKHGIPEPILARWEERFDGKLLPLQIRAVEEYQLLEGASLLISAPTSSGKTFCGEMALVRAVQERKRAIFLVPLKAVAEEKYRHFSECYDGLGLQTVIATRDHPDNDHVIESGRFDIAVMVYEKFNSLLLTNFDLISQVGTIVIDELQMLEDETRGSQLELALTKLLYSDHHPQLIGLSAVLGEATGLAEWLGCRLLMEKVRPVELRRGIASDGRFYFRCHNSGELGEEDCRQGEDTCLTLYENIKAALESERQVLVFIKSRHETVTAAQRFAEYANLESVRENEAFFDDRLSDEEESSLLKNLRSLFAVGVAFHNADLTAAQRLVVEEGYRAGLISVVFATTTLSTGINLPAATVFIEAQKYRQQGYAGRPGLEPLSWAEYESMSGRAGRVGLMDEEGAAGRAVLFASGELEKSILWEYYIDKRPVPIESRLTAREIADILIDLFSSGLVNHPREVKELLNRSYHSFYNGVPINVVDDIYEVLLEDGFLVRQGDFLTATPLGQAVAITGFSVAGANHILRKSPLPETGSNARLLYQLLHSPEGKTLYLPGAGQRGADLPERFYNQSTEDNDLIRDLAAMRRELSPNEKSRLRLTFLIEDWMEGMSAIDIESTYNLFPGMMENLGYQAGWLLSSVAFIMKAHDRFSVLPPQLEDLALAAKTGLPGRLKGLYRDFGDLLFRREWIELYRRGIDNRKEFLDNGGPELARMISSEARLDKIETRIQKIKEDVMQEQRNSIMGSSAWPESIEIVGTPVRERFQIRINGRSINLTGKSFKYLLRLVWSRLTKDNGWLYKEDLERGFNQARYLYRLRQEIGRDFLPDWPLYENNRSGYYRLAAECQGLKVDVDAIREIPDYEIQQMALDLTPLMSS
jgi:replicative superfamily II helicase